ncbi:hypothetical protein BD410DRAFT_839366 [Rickenella mellea]|uniref:Uncharacterized protein n=1 Tax=Rickenella mellea TaxID=50990 RepID=A0A4Y7Q6L3_9AGAM|nr:hypothetical protein BD410DRAFT_839366 [Rickenella mellea]
MSSANAPTAVCSRQEPRTRTERDAGRGARALACRIAEVVEAYAEALDAFGRFDVGNHYIFLITLYILVCMSAIHPFCLCLPPLKAPLQYSDPARTHRAPPRKPPPPLLFDRPARARLAPRPVPFVSEVLVASKRQLARSRTTCRQRAHIAGLGAGLESVGESPEAGPEVLSSASAS